MIEPSIQTAKQMISDTIMLAERDEDVSLWNILRPTTLDEYVGQMHMKKNLTILCEAAKERNEPLDHVLLSGPPGRGKTTLAQIIANMMGYKLVSTSGPALEKAADVAGLLSGLQPNTILFIDEIHRLRTQLEELLYSAMEDGFLDITVGKGPSARIMRVELPPFTVIGATTKSGNLSKPFLDRFGIAFRLEYYTLWELALLLRRSFHILWFTISTENAEVLASYSRGTPRIANRLSKRFRDIAQLRKTDTIDAVLIREGLELLHLSPDGLDMMDRQFLDLLDINHPKGLTTLAAQLHEDEDTLENVIEPFLLQQGYIEKTPRGRILTIKGAAYKTQYPL